MKHIKYILLSFLAGFACLSCNDDYLEKYPVEKLTEGTAFNTYENFKTYAWTCYGVFNNSNILRKVGDYGQDGYYTGDVYAGYLTRKGTSQYNPYAFQTINNVASGNGWNFEFIRKVNIMLDNIDDSSMTEAEKGHWRSVGYFFRSFYYMELIARFGDVPWIDKVLNDNDTEVIYAPRTPRAEVADKVLADLLYAEENINPEGDGQNTIDVHCVRALLSRFALFEGTWRKYHGLGNQEKYLSECVSASEKLIASFPNLHTDYGEMFTSEDLSKVPGVILYKEFATDLITAWHCHYERTSSHNIEMPKSTVDMYLCQDGRPIKTSKVYAGDKTPYTTFRNRDHRFLQTVAPPYKLSSNSGPNSWDYPEDEQYREYLDIMGVTTVRSNPGEAGKHKVFPLMNWSASIVLSIPNLTTKSSQQFLSCRGGYYVYKHYNVWDLNYNNGKTNTADIPIFKIEEVLLNYAEAKWELGQFTQDIADKTINKLRPRARVANMKVAEIDGAFDPDRDPAIDPVLWEIRRERITELMGEGFGFYDIRRWKNAPWFVNKQHYGMWASKEEIGTGRLLNMQSKVPDDSLTESYIYLFDDPVQSGKGWLDKYYLYMVPTNQIALNPAIEQNPGWN